MKLPPPRVIIIDDNEDHLAVLAANLHRQGVACLPVHFTGEVEEIPACPHTRVLFVDLHLTEAGAGTDNRQHFTTIGGLLEETLRPAGPYAVVLWTQYPEQAEDLRQFLESRLQGVAKPFAVVALSKTDHLKPDNSLKNADALAAAIESLMTARPQLAALFNWEDRVLGASAATVSAVIELAIAGAAPADRGPAIGQLLFHFALEAAGAGNVEADRFRAVNDALLPILADRVAFLRADSDAELWDRALSGQSADAGMTREEAARLNRMLHVAPPAGVLASERGAVVLLPDDRRDQFEAFFGMAEADAAQKQFGCKEFEADGRFQWCMVQVQAACDYAQRQPGPLPFVLALEFPAALALTKSIPAAVTATPIFDREGSPRILHVNARFQVSISKAEAANLAVQYRLREPVLNLMGYELHNYSARPGIVAFREKKAKTAPT
jgi:hypothetical protein